MDAYESLANAIILSAVNDYRNARAKLSKGRKNQTSEDMISECERFFKSEWFMVLTNIDGEMLLEKLLKEFEK